MDPENQNEDVWENPQESRDNELLNSFWVFFASTTRVRGWTLHCPKKLLRSLLKRLPSKIIQIVLRTHRLPLPFLSRPSRLLKDQWGGTSCSERTTWVQIKHTSALQKVHGKMKLRDKFILVQQNFEIHTYFFPNMYFHKFVQEPLYTYSQNKPGHK